MIGDFSWLFIVAAAGSANLAAHVLWFRIFPSGGMFRALLAGFFVGCGVLAVTSWVLGAPSVWNHLSNGAIYLCFSYVYFHWNNMGETARRIRLVTELRQAPRGLSRAEILVRYGQREIIDRRLKRLLESRQIKEVDARYHLDNPSVLAMARIMAFAKRALAME